MPYITLFEPNPHDESLPVLTELPPGVAETQHFMSRLKEARGRTADGVYREFHFCPLYEGWIEGHAFRYDVSNLGLLSGRRGRCYSCRRCGEEIAFSGIVS